MKSDFADETYFAAAFPLPFRVLCLVGLGILGWAMNLHGLHIWNIDAPNTLELSLSAHDGRRLTSPLPTATGWRHAPAGPPPHRAVYKVFGVYAGWTLACWVVFRVATSADAALVDGFKFVPALAVLFVLTALVCPFDVLHKHERDRFLQAVHRCLFPSPHRVYFSDVVFADIFTSFAKVLGDVWLSVWMLLPSGSLLSQPSQDGLWRWVLPTIMSIPYAVRLRQCLVEYNAPANESRRPLFNALKYASSFPVIYLSAAQRLVVSDTIALKGEAAANQPWHGEHHLFRLWLLAAAFNSLYTFWWDVTNDWGLDLLRPKYATNASPRTSVPPRPLLLPRLHSRSPLIKRPESPLDEPEAEQLAYTNAERGPHPYGLRPTLLYPLPVYPFAILVDLVLRLTWSAKLSSHLHSYAEGDLIIFWIELAEVVRRWMWVFLRVEWETVKEVEAHAPRSPPPRLVVDRGDSYRDAIPEDAEFELVPSEQHGRGSDAG
ncbi:Protein ERD1 -like protein [Trametes pubescens]|uniref:Protein ERD1-like protein n=1 Tax=Trametes pubescens TaxID=154538 RepID=A0A1M2W7G1_TRAPU|nr:Protein ERD1 -like protein [Trametes pubescens]